MKDRGHGLELKHCRVSLREVAQSEWLTATLTRQKGQAYTGLKTAGLAHTLFLKKGVLRMIVLILQLTADRLHVTKFMGSLEPGTNYFSNLKLKLELGQMEGTVSASTAKKKKSKSLSAILEPCKEVAHLVQDTSLNYFRCTVHTREPALFSSAEDPNCAGNLPKFQLTSTFHQETKMQQFPHT